uniref:Uncharacterized protein n=1 Tax=Arundo donax TaxID=35708 RepID=A0A0A9BR51_ARUDO
MVNRPLLQCSTVCYSMKPKPPLAIPNRP